MSAFTFVQDARHFGKDTLAVLHLRVEKAVPVPVLQPKLGLSHK